MRTLFLTVSLGVAALVLAGCEDGPNQVYSPAPVGAANVWNSQNVDGGATDGGQAFDAGYPTVSKTTLCSTDLKRERWAWMLTQPVKPPRQYAGIDLAGSDNWEGLTIENAEKAPATADDPTGGLCQSTAFGFEGTCPSGSGGCNGNAWGNNGEVSFSWNVATHLIDQMVLGLGYTGTLVLDPYPDHNGEVHSYTIAIGDVLRRGDANGGNNETYLLNWGDKTQRAQQITDMFNAAMATYAEKGGLIFDTSTCNADTDCKAPGTVSSCQCAHDPANPGKCTAPGKCGVTDCSGDGNCLVYADGSNTIMGFRPLVVYVEGNDGLPQPAESTPIAIYNFFSKSEPFSNLPQEVKLDAVGPVAQGTPTGLPEGATTVCKQAIGQSFDDFKANCVQVHGDSSDPKGVDAVNLNKILYGLTHDQEHWTANVLGVNQNFTSGKTISDPDYVVLDSDTPSTGDIAEDWTFDSRARGDTANDDFGAGSSLVGIEWARLLLESIAAVRNEGRPAGAPPIPVMKLNDPRCVGFDGGGNPNYKSNIDTVTGQTICSGAEGLMLVGGGGPDTNGRSDFSEDPGAAAFLTKHVANLNPTENFDVNGAFYSGTFLKPGDVTGAVCIDPADATDCTLDSVSIFQNLLKHVTRVLGNGDVNKLPTELRDRRFYYKTFGQAFIKYLKAYGAHDAATRNLYPGAGGGVSPTDVANTDIDLESFFFDYDVAPGTGGSQTYDKFEYIDRDFIGQGAQPGNTVPWDFEYGIDLFGGNQRYDNWYRRMDREEVLLYESLLQDETHTAGQENTVNITNIFGSPLVSGIWPSYNCAIGNYEDPAGADGPLDPDGNDCSGTNPPLDPATTLPACGAGGKCAAGKTCISANSYENGAIEVCASACDYNAHKDTGCANGQACLSDGNGGSGCVDMLMDRNDRTSKYSHPIMYYYPGAWTPSLFSKGHSPVHFDASDKRPGAGVVKLHVPDFQAGNYVVAQIPAPTTGDCPTGYAKDTSGAFCNAVTKASAPELSALVPWQEVQPGIGFRIPIDGSHSQWVSTGQLDFTGVLETYIVDYVPNYDTGKASCVSDGQCNPGFTCNKDSDSCLADDNTIRIQAVEGDDFIGEAFLCQDPTTGDILHVHQYDSMIGIVDWLAAHPGTSETPSAQNACQIIVSRSENDLFVDSITSKSAGVVIIDGGGQGQGRATDIVLFDTNLIQGL